MNSEKRFNLLPRVVMFGVMLALIIYTMHFVLPDAAQSQTPEVALNPLFQIGLFLMLSLVGALIGFWITFGDLVNRDERQTGGQ